MLQNIATVFKPSESSLLSPIADVLMAGGLSILIFFMMLFIPESQSTYIWSWTAYYLAFIVNYPHFAASYQLLYQDARPHFFAFDTNKKFALKLWWAGLVVPIILLCYFLYALSEGSQVLMGYMVNAMFFFVGWHYIKQIFGTVVVLSVTKKVFYNKFERWSILVPLYTLWAISYINSNVYAGTRDYYGIPYSSLGLPGIIVKILYVVLAVSTVAFLTLLVRKYVKDKLIMPLGALLAIVSIYLWFLPAFSHPYYLLIIPFLHSLQYLLFVGAYKRNQAINQTHDQNAGAKLTNFTLIAFIGIPVVIALIAILGKVVGSLETILKGLYGMLPILPLKTWGMTVILILLALLSCWWLWLKGRTSALSRVLLFVLEMIILGALLFSILPTLLDILAHNSWLPDTFLYNTSVFGGSLYIFLFIIFVNIHHYFIDNVIWKKDNPNLKENLYYHNHTSVSAK